MVRSAIMVTLVAILSPAALLSPFHLDHWESFTIEGPRCPSEDILSLGCTCRADTSFRITIRCDATRWNAQTSAKIAEIFKDSTIWGFQFYGEPKWESQGRDPKTLRLIGPVVFAPFTPLCGLNILNFELKNFVYDGYPPECRFQHWVFNNATVNLPLYIAALGHATELSFINQQHIGSLNSLHSLRTISLYKCGFFDTKNIRGLSDLQSLNIYGTHLQTKELSAVMLPRDPGSLRLLKLRGCNITTVNSDLSRSMKSLEELDLSYNQIVDLPRDLIKTDSHRRPFSLNLAGNPLDCDKLKWLEQLIETGAVSLIDEEFTYCANPRGIRFIKERKLNLNVDVQEDSGDSFFCGVEIPAAVVLCLGLAAFLMINRLRRERAARSRSWFDESFPREDQPCMKQDKSGHLPKPSEKSLIYTET